MRGVLAAALAIAAVVVGAASAHEDLPIVDATIDLAPGASATFPTALHYHRVVGTYALADAASSVSIRMVAAGEGGFDELLVDRAEETGRLNALIRCCDGQAWAEAELQVRNDGSQPATIDLRAWAMHDDFAVVVDRAESGAMSVPLVLFLGLGGAAGGAAWRDRRRRDAVSGSPAMPASLLWSAGLFVAALVAAASLGLAGMLRYGAGPVDGMIAILADVPVPGGPFGARDAMVMSVLMLAWMGAIGFWSRSVHVGAHRSSPWPVRLGLALGLVSLAGGLAMGWTYGSYGVPVLLGASLAVPLVWASMSVSGTRSAGTRSDGVP